MGSIGAKAEIDFGHFTNIVNDQPRHSERQYRGVDPTNKEALWDVPVASVADVDNAVEAASRAFASWSTLPGPLPMDGPWARSIP
ncbi:uncharacterized protein PV07_05243 [Cladophialophora immunda]|uniref:Aldehyde dehydrogenase domain-containing protein n=1 Tax=Cladophialophora immunda TaxID=569365 RepID=A0A0D2CE65_9EURO|nr:uncharacterized protein PV07_05243 [Cladophialophora immunda]KIW29428.1 hypothetical protein PV07_05243 [Cladophialophora immunda]OQV09353.1 hypothetical protein CLAIMM_13483 [Cladophialophora immunda]